jgi:hypothetical protein
VTGGRRPLAAAAAAALLAGAAAPGPSRLLPVTDADAYSTGEGGCESGFRRGRDTLLFMIGHSLVLRDGAGRHVCRITDRQFGGFGYGPTAISCAGRRFTLRRTGAVVTHEEADSAEGPALLTIREGGRVRHVAGRWGTAC